MSERDFDLEKLTEAYFRYYFEKRDDDFWAWEILNEQSHEEPEKAWSTILYMLHRAPSKEAISWVAAGPLEDLLAIYGDEIIDTVMIEADKNRRLLYALSSVIPSEEQPQAFEKLGILRKKYKFDQRDRMEID